jgi:hypothetical protein
LEATRKLLDRDLARMEITVALDTPEFACTAAVSVPVFPFSVNR